MSMVANCGHDSRYQYSGDTAGDQNGDEWQVKAWYSYPWNVVLWHPDANVRAKMAELATKAAQNDAIGYDQSQRYDFWTQLKSVGYDPSKITVACEADCSAGVAAIVKATGILLGDEKLAAVSIFSYTGNIKQNLINAGFEAHTENQYVTTDANVPLGAVWLKEGSHTTIQVTDGDNISASNDVIATYRVYTTHWLSEIHNLEDYAGIDDQVIKAIAIKVNVGRIKYRVHRNGIGWLGWMWGENYDLNNEDTGFAGNCLDEIDAVQVYYYTPDSIRPYKQAKYRVSRTGRESYYDWQYDTDTDNDMDGYAGCMGKSIDRFQLTIE